MNRLTDYTAGGLGGVIYRHFIVPFENGDVYSIVRGHPLFGMVEQANNQALAASSVAYPSFATVAQELATAGLIGLVHGA